jgi:2-keto-4-pentenoate hydratase/2-oxohepta-3-ene-1,7-dioic acid hydratase in catechol pathway
MSLVRFLDVQGQVVQGERLADGSFIRLVGNVEEGFQSTGRPIQPAKLLAPIMPTAIIGIGLNYRQHAEESGAEVPKQPVVFMKSLNTLLNPGEPIVLPRALRSDKVDYECELAIVIGKKAKNLKPDNALDCVLGYTCANDVSARDWQKEWGGSQWCRGKSFDTFCPLGPAIVTPTELPDPNALGIRTRLNGEVMQDWTTNDMIFSVRDLLVFLSGSTTLLPGTVILTGTPQGVGMARTPPVWLKAGDEVTVEIDGIGSLTNHVIEEGA